MKKYLYVRQFLLPAVSATILTSCGSVNTNDFAAKKYTNFHNKQQAIEFKKHESEMLYAGTDVNYLSPKEVKRQQAENSSFEEIEFKETNLTTNKKELRKKIKAQLKSIERKNQSTTTEFKKTKSTTNHNDRIFTATKAPSEDSQFWVEIILALLIPPLGVYLHVQDLNDKFWISLILTLLFWIPGSIYAILVVTDSI